MADEIIFMTSKQWTAIGSIGTIIGIIFTIVQLRNDGTEISNVNESTINVNATIGTQNNIYENEPDPSWENPRSLELSQLYGRELIETWFRLMNTGKWKEGCSLMAKDKCDAENGENVLEHSKEPRVKAVDGYQDIHVWHSDSAPKDTWCVKYKYQERQSSVARDIVLIMQYKLSPRSDGGEDIASRLCEKTWMSDLNERNCSIPASVHYCL